MELDLATAIKRGFIHEAKIRFNGIDCKDCVYVSEEKGETLVYDFESFNPSIHRSVPKKTLYGDVWIMLGDSK